MQAIKLKQLVTFELLQATCSCFLNSCSMSYLISLQYHQPQFSEASCIRVLETRKIHCMEQKGRSTIISLKVHFQSAQHYVGSAPLKTFLCFSEWFSIFCNAETLKKNLVFSCTTDHSDYMFMFISGIVSFSDTEQEA